MSHSFTPLFITIYKSGKSIMDVFMLGTGLHFTHLLKNMGKLIFRKISLIFTV